jgi:DNA replication protein DnaC
MKPKTKPAAKPTTQATADTMTTTTEQAAEQNPAPTSEQAPEPTPACAFGTFIQTRPALQEIADLTGESFDHIKHPSDGWGFGWTRAILSLDSLPEPPPLPEVAFLKQSIDPLMEKLLNPDLTDEQRREIQQRILDIKAAPFAPIREHREKIERLQKLAADAVTDFEEWITTDPEGITAAAQDKAHDAWMAAEDERRQREAEEAERQARAEKHRARCREEASDLQHEIGAALFDTNLDHPDIDGATIKDFLEWHTSEWMKGDGTPRNAVLVGKAGAGKTRALASAAVTLCLKEGIAGIEWITAYEFADLVSSLAKSNKHEASAHLRRLSDAECLFFDDLGSINFTAPRTSKFFSLIDERYRHNRATFFSTQYSTPQLKKIFSARDDEEASPIEASRILRRFIGTTSTPLAKFFHFKRSSGRRCC